MRGLQTPSKPFSNLLYVLMYLGNENLPRCVKDGLFCVHSIISAHHNKYAVVPPEHICDGEKHCRNNEDEENCQGGQISLSL